MSSATTSTAPSLAVDRAGAPFALPDAAVTWRVYAILANGPRRHTLWTGHGILYVPLDATTDHVRDAVASSSGRHELVPVDEDGSLLAPVADAEVAP